MGTIGGERTLLDEAENASLKGKKKTRGHWPGLYLGDENGDFVKVIPVGLRRSMGEAPVLLTDCKDNRKFCLCVEGETQDELDKVWKEHNIQPFWRDVYPGAPKPDRGPYYVAFRLCAFNEDGSPPGPAGATFHPDINENREGRRKTKKRRGYCGSLFEAE